MTFGTPPTSTATRVNDGFADEAATPPRPAINSRRRIRHLLSPHCAQPIAAGNAWERVNTELSTPRNAVIAARQFGSDRRRSGHAHATREMKRLTQLRHASGKDDAAQQSKRC
jgi:hypothetical protein